MMNLIDFKNEIIKYTLVMALITEIISLIPLGFDTEFLVGLALGTVITVLNFKILVFTGAKLVEMKSSLPVVGGYFVRLPIYGVAFYICIKFGLACGAGCAFGFISLHIALLVIYGIKNRFFGGSKNSLNDWTDPKEWKDPGEWDNDDDSGDF